MATPRSSNAFSSLGSDRIESDYGYNADDRLSIAAQSLYLRAERRKPLSGHTGTSRARYALGVRSVPAMMGLQ